MFLLVWKTFNFSNGGMTKTEEKSAGITRCEPSLEALVEVIFDGKFARVCKFSVFRKQFGTVKTMGGTLNFQNCRSINCVKILISAPKSSKINCICSMIVSVMFPQYIGNYRYLGQDAFI